MCGCAEYQEIILRQLNPQGWICFWILSLLVLRGTALTKSLYMDTELVSL